MNLLELGSSEGATLLSLALENTTDWERNHPRYWLNLSKARLPDPSLTTNAETWIMTLDDGSIHPD